MVVKVHSSWAEFRDYFRQQVFLVLYNGLLDLLPNASLTPFVLGPLSLMQEGEKRLLAFTKRGTSTHSVSHPSFLVFLWLLVLASAFCS